MSVKLKIVALLLLLICVQLTLSAPGFFSFLSDSFVDDYKYRPRTFLIDDATQDTFQDDESDENDLVDWWRNFTGEEPPYDVTTSTTERPEYPAEIKEELEKALGPWRGTKPTSKNFKNWDFSKASYQKDRKYITDFDSAVSYFEERDKWIMKQSRSKPKSIVDVIDNLENIEILKRMENETPQSSDNNKKKSNKQQKPQQKKKKNNLKKKRKKGKN